MTTSFEDQVREDLRAAAGGAAFDHLEPASVIGLGQRAVRRRRLGYAAGAASLALAVAVAVGVGLGANGPGRAVTPPANRSTTATAAASSAAVLTVGDDARYRVTLTSDQRLTFEYFDQARGWVTTLVEAQADPARPTWVASADIKGTVLAVMPSRVEAEDPVVGPGVQLETSAWQELGDTGYRAQAYRVSEGSKAPLTITGWRWRDAGTGRVASTQGEISSADVTLPGGRQVDIWVDEQGREWGLLGESRGALPDGSWSEPQVLASIQEENVATGLVWGIAPAGTTTITPRLSSGTQVSATTTRPIGDTGLVAFAATVEGPVGTVKLEGVDWTDAAGTEYSKDLATS